MGPRLVIAIGGNGFTSATSPGLDDLVLGAVPGGVRRIGFVGTASEDDPVRIGHFHALVAPRVELASLFDRHATAAQAARWAAGLDAIYVGGGDTARMLASWRAAGIDEVFASAGRDGVVLAGDGDEAVGDVAAFVDEERGLDFVVGVVLGVVEQAQLPAVGALVAAKDIEHRVGRAGHVAEEDALV